MYCANCGYKLKGKEKKCPSCKAFFVSDEIDQSNDVNLPKKQGRKWRLLTLLLLTAFASWGYISYQSKSLNPLVSFQKSFVDNNQPTSASANNNQYRGKIPKDLDKKLYPEFYDEGKYFIYPKDGGTVYGFNHATQMITGKKPQLLKDKQGDVVKIKSNNLDRVIQITMTTADNGSATIPLTMNIIFVGKTNDYLKCQSAKWAADGKEIPTMVSQPIYDRDGVTNIFYVDIAHQLAEAKNITYTLCGNKFSFKANELEGLKRVYEQYKTQKSMSTSSAPSNS